MEGGRGIHIHLNPLAEILRLKWLEKVSVSLRNGLEKTSVSLRNTNYYRAWPYYGDLLTLSQAHYGD